MRPEAFKRSARGIAGAFCSLLVCALAAPCSADAGCDRHATARPVERGDWAGLVELGHLGALVGGGDASTPATPGPRPPCTGAFCSGRPATAPTASPPKVPAPEPWALADAPVRVAAPGAAWFPTDEPPVGPSYLSRDIFHPPRARTV
jgi:hypothetical protein